jgi:hypothetical protein
MGLAWTRSIEFEHRVLLGRSSDYEPTWLLTSKGLCSIPQLHLDCSIASQKRLSAINRFAYTSNRIIVSGSAQPLLRYNNRALACISVVAVLGC